MDREPTLLRLDSAQAGRAWLPQLCDLLLDEVSHGASIGFLAPLSAGEALDYWEEVLARLGSEHRLWLLLDGPRLLGSVQLSLCERANGRHRAEVQKLFVTRRARGQGHARRLMQALELEARAAARTLLVLDTEAGSLAETVYRRLGWRHAGEIPAFAASPDGELRATALYFKLLKHKPQQAEGTTSSEQQQQSMAHA
ncbi:GNAT family N-acetyltransferase [Pelomonas sp. SE-A7]|uniref:GNAT family N-acetyltransferase n=1 Tax=Pelomonas sp. SE-A7 TaxID=3054953 RepID=UPI00259D10E6|nr:GNAT family N-acetyltransferase [Pelomonas sp. SE-A7]MDM4767948.1 GNAT family N-acetyltransferase [Pelomonas sp. SE-A7]